ncbi:MAG: cofactor-independent phosphoglycerate mutase [Oscillospiraceae bacterium]|nr:cofactor-independent phosphoglycerate mutase [Oscillospiraceae bacterium]
MKYLILLCDGMADTPCPCLDGHTPMELARKPHMDALAARGEFGLVRTVPPGIAPGSDVANLSILGYDPTKYYTGRSPLEAANIGVQLADTDVAFRANLVLLSDEADYTRKTMLDYSAGDISTAAARPLIERLQQEFGGGAFDFYPGVAYRHCMIWHGGDTAVAATPPHDISGRPIKDYLPGEPLLTLMQQAEAILHPYSLWLWGQGRRPQLPSFESLHGLRGAMISAVDLLNGIARLTGMTVCRVEGATGYIDTNFEGKAAAAAAALADHDFVYIHVEAPDECGHRGEVQNKIHAIEAIDSRLLTPLLDSLAGTAYTLLILPDHPTPLALRTHTSDPVPYLLCRSDANGTKTSSTPPSASPIFTEAAAAATGVYIDNATALIEHMKSGA